MKRFVSMLLAVVMLLCIIISSASAAGFSTPTLSKNGVHNTSAVEKTTGNGVAAGADVSNMTTNATFHFRVWKSSPVWQASDGVRKTGIGHVTMTTLYDNYGQPRLWKEVSYYLAVTHSQYSNVSSGSTCGEWNP